MECKFLAVTWQQGSTHGFGAIALRQWPLEKITCVPFHLHAFLYSRPGQPLLRAGPLLQTPCFVCEHKYSCRTQIILGLLLLVVDRNLVVKPPPNAVSVTVFSAVYPVTFRKNTAEQKFTYDIKEGIGA